MKQDSESNSIKNLLDFLFVDGRMDVDETSKDVVRLMVVNKTKEFGNLLRFMERNKETLI